MEQDRGMSTTQYIGTVVEDLPEDSVLLKVNVTNLYPNALSGDIAPSVSENTLTIQDTNGGVQNVTTHTTGHIEATWESISNMPYPPLVRKGERVLIFKYADTDKYYWRALGDATNRKLRKTDRLRFEAGSVTEFNTEKTDDTTYFIEIDPHKHKRIVLATSKKNGEKAKYIFEINGESGYIILSDGDPDTNDTNNNRLIINTELNTIQLNNSKNSIITLADENITLKCDGTFTINAGKQIVLDSENITMNKDHKNSTMVINSDNTTFNVGQSLLMNGKSGDAVVGLNVQTAVTKPLVADAVRTNTICNGEVGTAYSASHIDIETGNATIKSNSPNNDMLRPTNRTAVAFEQSSSAIKLIQEAVNTLLKKEGLPEIKAHEVYVTSVMPSIRGL